MVDPPDLYGRNSCVDPSELRRASSQQDEAAAEEMPPSSSFSYAAAHTPRASAGRATSAENNNLLLNDDDVASERSSHRDRFLSDAERLVAMDPRKTRESFAQVDHREDQWAWHEKPVATILEGFGVEPKLGLDAENASKRLAENGPNSLKAEKRVPVYIIFLLQFTNVIIGLLMAAALASIALQEYVEGLAIIAIVTLNAVIATIQERNASNALEALQKMTSPQCVVLRDGGRQVQIPSEQLVTGDIVVLTTGDIVPADIRLIHSADFKVND
ncbi:hypothetical protein PPTG_09920 [Phytophthora nicotianae INRA-310]|uniref:Cation-transporting P-type ATPase N-terminal domain-containing protein n=1 Tax=Phytophthora nicotianae (strain INRA-310) TaxID=761204 RepID=W2QEC4_PHYN3|nr:hypothetical protein PPTG_09920 [Phytophthora nicotianae INRA-310]ETN10854.1 hypothetical protein PPTG_09920 [Phytophthora nicotianae INRA-310]